MNATRRDLEIQFARVVAQNWLGWFQREAKRAGTTTAHLLAIGSRETNLKNIRGDWRGGKYHGFGVMQVDIGTDANYAKTWTPEKVEPSIIRGVDIYLSKVRDTKNTVGKRITARTKFFVGRAVDAEDVRRIATAAYNCGRWAYYHFSNGQNVDTTTTGDDYSRDVYDRAIEFADILEERGIEKLAVHQELKLQGKYARKAHREAFGFYDLPERVATAPGIAQECQEELCRVDYERSDIVDNPFLISDDKEIDLLAGSLGSTSTVPDPAGSNIPTSGPSNPVELPALGTDQSVPNEGDLYSQTISQTRETSAGSQTNEISVPAGDPPDAEPLHFYEIEDWKPLAKRWISRIWKSVPAIGIPSIGTLGFASFNDMPRWYIYVAIAVVIVAVLIFLAIVATLILLAIWLIQNRGIPALKKAQLEILANPDMKNVGLKFIKK